MLWELWQKRFEENRGNRTLCHLNPFEFFDHTGSHGREPHYTGIEKLAA